MSNGLWQKAADALTSRALLEKQGGEVSIERCTLRAGTVWQVPTFPMDDRAQVFFFLNDAGYIVTDSKAWNIAAQSMFVPNFDREGVVIKAVGRDLEMFRFQFDMTPYDVDLYLWYHMILPRYVGYEQAFSYLEEHTGLAGSAVRTSNLIVETAFGRWFFGMNYGTGGPEFVGEHMHPEFDQWVCVLPGADFTYVIDGQERRMRENDVALIKMGTKHQILPTDEGKIRYLWLKCATNGWSKGRDGDIGSEP